MMNCDEECDLTDAVYAVFSVHWDYDCHYDLVDLWDNELGALHMATTTLKATDKWGKPVEAKRDPHGAACLWEADGVNDGWRIVRYKLKRG